MENKVAPFDRAAQVYDQTRPSYPDVVIDWIIRKTGVRQDERLLEIGPGTGQATFKFAERGYRIHAVELGPNLAKLLLEKNQYLGYDIRVDVSSFEEWEPPSGYRTSFIFSATAFHWIDPAVSYRNCHSLLKEEGCLVLMWNNPLPEDAEPVRRAFQLLEQYSPTTSESGPPFPQRKISREDEINQSGFFKLTHAFEHRWILENTPESLANAFFTYSPFLSLERPTQQQLAKQVKELYRDLPDLIKTTVVTSVFIARKR